MHNIDSVLDRGVTNVIPDKQSLAKLLMGKRKLNVYLGIDPTATRIHLGHAVPLRKINEFAQAGHNVTFLIGDFTALIGDASDKDKERPVLTYDTIQKNFETYKTQAEKLVDFSKISVKFNSEWLSKLSFADIVQLCQHFSVGDFVNREMVKNRLKSGSRVALHEVLYPVMQGYDSYFMDTDIQVGGADQTFNMQAGRLLQRDLRNKESYVLVTGYLEGTDGRKMSKSWGNAIWLTDEPGDMYGKTMSLRDELIVNYFRLATTLPEEEIATYQERLTGGENPMDIKKKLAHQIVTELHNKAAADQAATAFESTFQQGQVPDEIEAIALGTMNIVDALVASGVVDSKSVAKRLIQEGAVTVEGTRITDTHEKVEPTPEGVVLKVGRRNFVRLVATKKADDKT